MDDWVLPASRLQAHNLVVFVRNGLAMQYSSQARSPGGTPPYRRYISDLNAAIAFEWTPAIILACVFQLTRTHFMP